MSRHKVGTYDAFPPGEGRRVEIDGIEIAIFNLDGELYGIQNLCVHKNLPLHLAGQQPYISEGVDDEYVRGEVDTDEVCVRCPFHGMKWDLESGENPATHRRIATYDVDVVDDDVFVEV